MVCYRRMLNVEWVYRIKNEEVLEKIREKRTLWKNLKKRKSLNDRAQDKTWRIAKVGKKRGKGKTWIVEHIPQIMKDMGCRTFRVVKELAWDRIEWRRVFASN